MPARSTRSNTEPLAAALRAFRARSDEETAAVARIEEVLSSGDPWDRSSPLHVTSSALIVHPATRRVLLRWHERQQAWLQVGGHADPGETDPLDVVRREAHEETGLTDCRPFPDPTRAAIIHVVIVPVAPGRGEAAHQHADLRYVLSTEQPDAVVPERPGAPLRWLTIPEAMEIVDTNVQITLGRVAELMGGPPGGA